MYHKLTALDYFKLLDISVRNERPMHNFYEVYSNLVPVHIPKLSISQLVFMFNIMTKKRYGLFLGLL